MPILLPRLALRRPSFPRFNGVGSAGPRRLLVIGGSAVAIGAVLVGATFITITPPVISQAGRLPPVDPLPGGLNSNPHQDALALRSNQQAAATEQVAGRSFTPQIAASQSYVQKVATRQLLTSPPRATPPEPTPPASAAAATPPQPPSLTTPASEARVIPVQATTQGSGQTQGRVDPEDARYRVAIERMMGGWGTRPPRTDVIIPPEVEPPQGNELLRSGPGRGSSDAMTTTPVASRSGRPERGRVLLPAGRGVYAHTILAASSDASSPVVLQADSGPIAGDRMIGSFSREDERLVIRISRLIHDGQEINVEGIAVAPATMEAGVASSVDQHYLSRFLLPAAAAFVQGLGQALSFSNSSITQSPFGGTTAFSRLNPTQQLGVGAGVAAGRLGQALDQSAPRGPTVKVDAGSSLGVMFLGNVTVPD